MSQAGPPVQERFAQDPLAGFVLLSLAQAADANGLARVDVGHISEMAESSKSAIQKALRRLVAAGLIDPRGDLCWVDLAAALAPSASEVGPDE